VVLVIVGGKGGDENVSVHWTGYLKVNGTKGGMRSISSESSTNTLIPMSKPHVNCERCRRRYELFARTSTKTLMSHMLNEASMPSLRLAKLKVSRDISAVEGLTVP
jgi:hypothetical protein